MILVSEGSDAVSPHRDGSLANLKRRKGPRLVAAIHARDDPRDERAIAMIFAPRSQKTLSSEYSRS